MKVFIGKYQKNDKPRTIRVRIDDYDVWGMDHTLSLIIHPMLLKLKEKKQGSPFVDDIDLPEEVLKKIKNLNPEEKESCTHEKWDWVLDEIIWTFDQIKNGDGDSKFFQSYGKPEFIRQDDGLFKMVYKEEPKIDMEGLKNYSKRIKEGLILFGKYFQALWD